MAEEIWCATLEDEHIGTLSTYLIHEWLSARAEVIKEVQLYWSFRDEGVVIERIKVKGRRIVVPAFLQKREMY